MFGIRPVPFDPDFSPDMKRDVRPKEQSLVKIFKSWVVEGSNVDDLNGEISNLEELKFVRSLLGTDRVKFS